MNINPLIHVGLISRSISGIDCKVGDFNCTALFIGQFQHVCHHSMNMSTV